MLGLERAKNQLAAIALLCAACSGGSTEVTPEPSIVAPPASAPPTSVATAPPESAVLPTSDVIVPDPTAPAVPLSSTTDAHHVRGRYVAELEVEDLHLPAGDTVRVLHPNATVRARLDALIASSLTEFIADAQQAADPVQPEIPRCTALAATRTLVSIECNTIWDPGGRGSYMQTHVGTFAFEIVGEEVRPPTLDAFVPNADLAGAIHRALVEARDAQSEEYQDAEMGWHELSSGLSEYGLHVVWTDDYGYGYVLEGEVPYESVVDQIRADGPVARMLRLGAFARGATPPSTDAPGAASARGPWVIGPRVPLSEVATRWASLPDRLRPAVSLYVVDSLAQLGISADVGLEAAQEVAAALHGALAPAPAQARLHGLAVYRANGSVNVRADSVSTAAWLGALPRDSLVTVVTDPETTRTPSWDHVVGTGFEGWSSGRYLEPDPMGCLPDAARAIDHVPQAAREAATRNVLRVRTTVFDGTRSTPGVVLLTHADGHTYVSLRRLSSATCRVGEEVASWILEGIAVDALVTRTTSQGGETLVLVQTSDDEASRGPTTWVALRRGTASPVWTHQVPTHPSDSNDVRAPARVGPSGRGFWPLALVERGRPIMPFRWDGTTLVQDTP